MSCDTTSIYIDPLHVLGGIIDITTLAGTGTGETLVNDGTGNDLVTKDLIAGAGITLTPTATDITIVNAVATPTLQDAYDNGGGPPQIVLTPADGPVTIQDNAVPTGGNLFAVQDSGGAVDVLSVDATSVTVDGKLNVTGAIDPTALVLNEQAAIPIAPVAGTGTLWVQDNAANDLVYTSGAGVDSVLSALNLQDVYANSTTPQIALDDFSTPFVVRGKASTPFSGEVFRVERSNGFPVFTITAGPSVTIENLLQTDRINVEERITFTTDTALPFIPNNTTTVLYARETSPPGGPARLIQRTFGEEIDITTPLTTSLVSTDSGFQFDGPWNAGGGGSETFTLDFYRVGGLAYVKFRAQTYPKDGTGATTMNSSGSFVPAELRPPADVRVPIIIVDTGATTQGSLIVLTSGFMSISVYDSGTESYGGFTNGGAQAGQLCPFDDDTIASWIIDT